MIDLIVFKVEENSFALNIDNVKRIIQARELTIVPNSSPLIDGIMSYEKNVIKVLNFRKLVGLSSYEEELFKFFEHIKVDLQEWVEMLKNSIENGTDFTKSTNPNSCEFGKWLNSFNSYSEQLEEIVEHLRQNHKELHELGRHLLKLQEKDPKQAQNIFHENVFQVYKNMLGYFKKLMAQIDSIANGLQKLIIYETDEKVFAIKVDKIEDIDHIDETATMNNNDKSYSDMEILGIIDINKVLVSVIKSIKLPS